MCDIHLTYCPPNPPFYSCGTHPPASYPLYGDVIIGCPRGWQWKWSFYQRGGKFSSVYFRVELVDEEIKHRAEDKQLGEESLYSQ